MEGESREERGGRKGGRGRGGRKRGREREVGGKGRWGVGKREREREGLRTQPILSPHISNSYTVTHAHTTTTCQILRAHVCAGGTKSLRQTKKTPYTDSLATGLLQYTALCPHRKGETIILCTQMVLTAGHAHPF